MMRDSLLTAKDIGSIVHARSLKAGDTQSMVFKDEDLPPVFDESAPKYDAADTTQSSKTRKLTKPELKALLEAKGFNGEGKVDQLRTRANEAGIPLTEITQKIVYGYVGKAKGAAQIACERGFVDLDGKLSNGAKFTMNGTLSKDLLTGVVTRNKETSVIRMLEKCDDFKNEKKQLMHIMDLIDARLILTPKCHPEIAGRGVEYAWGYSKLRFRQDFNDAIASNLKGNVIKLLDQQVLTLNRLRKFARKAREYKLTYSLLFHLSDENDGSAGKDDIEHITKVFKAHRSAMDSDYAFILKA